MTISVKHKFVTAKPDAADATLVRASNWNDEHNVTLAASSLLGRSKTSAGAMEEITLGQGLTFDPTPSQINFNAAVLAFYTTPIDSGSVSSIVMYNSLQGTGKLQVMTFASEYGFVLNTRNVSTPSTGGLQGGGNLSADLSLSLRTPGTLTAQTANDANGAHTHQINAVNVAVAGNAGLASGGVGTWLMAKQTAGTLAANGGNTAGGNIRPTDVDGSGANTGNQSGTWQAMGNMAGPVTSPGTQTTIIWLRVA